MRAYRCILGESQTLDIMSLQSRLRQPELLPVVAIDGPAGSGKSTVARQVATRLELPYLDTGAMYRALTCKAIQLGFERFDDADRLGKLAVASTIEFTVDGKTLLDGEDVSAAIRTPEVTQNVSAVSAIAAVRERMVAIQRASGIHGGVMEGRDIGTVVFPDAKLKIFLLASEQERARRRQADLLKMGVDESLESVLADLIRRDKLDSEREVSPLRLARDARKLDTTGLSVEQVVEQIVGWAHERGFGNQWLKV